MKFKYLLILICIFLLFPNYVFAAKGCCSHHGGVASCHCSGKQLCNDGTLSPSCTCTPTVTYVYGSTDEEEKKYNSSANKDDGSCEYLVFNEDDNIKGIDAVINNNNNNLEETSDGNSFLDCYYLVSGNIEYINLLIKIRKRVKD